MFKNKIIKLDWNFEQSLTQNRGNKILFQQMNLAFAGNNEFYYFDNKNMDQPFDMVAQAENIDGINDEVKNHIYVLPIKVRFMLDQENVFNDKIIDYVRKNSRNSILAKGKDDNKSKDCNNSGNGPGTISFRNN